MAESPSQSKGPRDNPKEAFISQTDRPEVRLSQDTPITEMRVRDLAELLSHYHHHHHPHGKIYITLAEGGPKSWIKDSKNELKDALGKHEYAEVPVDRVFPDPRLDRVIQVVSGLADEVTRITEQLRELKDQRAK